MMLLMLSISAAIILAYGGAWLFSRRFRELIEEPAIRFVDNLRRFQQLDD
jgi:hypothetical protein